MDSNTTDLLDLIKSRKSIRNFIYEKIDNDTIKDILECARWSPSGRNSQPWKVCIVTHPTVKRMLADLSKYGGIMESAYVDLVIFLDLEKGYDRVKDIQAMGAFIQNILLAVHAKGLGAVWIGEILSKKNEVDEIFKLSVDKFELMGVIAIGVIDEPMTEKNKKERLRRPIDEFIDWF
jgi:nitroreductase